MLKHLLSDEDLEWVESVSKKLDISVDDFVRRSVIAKCDLWEGYFNSKDAYPLTIRDLEVARLSSEISSKLKSKGFSNWLVGGTLLTAVRDNDLFLPWSRSITVGITDESISENFDWGVLGSKIFDEVLSGYEILSWDKVNLSNISEKSIHINFTSKFISQNQKCVYLCKDSGVAIFGGSDFNEYMKGKGLRGGTKKNKMIELQFFRKEKCESGENHLRPAQYPSGNTRIPTEWILPNKGYCFRGLYFGIPCESHRYLEFTLGKSWETPIVGVHSFRSHMASKGKRAKSL